MFQISVLFPLEAQKNGGKTASTLDSDSNTNPSPIRKGTSTCLVSVLNLAAIFGYVPFKIKLNSTTGKYDIQPLHLLRKVFCALTHATVLFVYAGLNKHVEIITQSKDLSSNFIQTFDIVSSVGSLVLTISFCITFWRHQNQLLKLLEATKVEMEPRTERKLKIIATGIFLLAYCSSSYINRNYLDNNPSAMYSDLFSAESPEEILCSLGMAIWDTFTYHALGMTYINYAFIALIGLTMRGVRIHFHKTMSDTLLTMDMKTGFEHYMALKELTTDITATFGNHILIYYIISVAYFAKIPESSLWRRHAETTAMLVYFSMGAIVWLSSAEFHMDVRDVVQNWATQMQDLDDLSVDTRIRLLSVVNDNLLDPIGVSCKFFTITYGFLGSMLGLIVTYAIIVFQMQTKPQVTALATQIPDFIMGTLFPASTTPSAN